MSWSRQHPRDPVFSTGGIFSWEDLNEMVQDAKQYQDPTTREGDIVHDKRRNIQVLRTKFPCGQCSSLLPTRIGLASHLMREHLMGRKDALDVSKVAEAVEVKEVFSDADIFYSVIKPRKILTTHPSPEIDLRVDPKQGTKMPTPKEREDHDLAMAKWREDMKDLSKRDEGLERFPNGLYYDPGDSPNWWYFAPQVWRQEAKEGKGMWMEPTDEEYQSWKDLTIPKRVLFLEWIVPDTI